MFKAIAALLVSAIVVFAADAAKAEPVKPTPSLSMEKKFAGAQLQKKVIEASAVKQIAKRDFDRAEERDRLTGGEWQRWEAEALKEIKAPDGCQINLDLEVQCPPPAPKPEVKK